MAKQSDINVVPQEAVDFFEKKKLKVGFDYRTVWGEEHKTAFTVAKVTQRSVLQTVKNAIGDSLKRGTTFQQFKTDVIGVLDKSGWTNYRQEQPLNHRLRTVFDTNLNMAYAAGQWERIDKSKEELPFLEYNLGPSEKHRPEHEALEGLVLPVDDPFWTYAMPPNGYGCKCWVRQVTRSEAVSLGLSKPPEPEYVEHTNSRTGNVELVPSFVQPGFNYNPGQQRDAGARFSAANNADAQVEGPGSPGTASYRFRELLLAGGKTDDEIFKIVQSEFGLDAKKRSYVGWYRRELIKKGYNVPGGKAISPPTTPVLTPPVTTPPNVNPPPPTTGPEVKPLWSVNGNAEVSKILQERPLVVPDKAAGNAPDAAALRTALDKAGKQELSGSDVKVKTAKIAALSPGQKTLQADPALVAKYREGWSVEPIVIDSKGAVVDGAKRLASAYAAGRTEIYVVELPTSGAGVAQKPKEKKVSLPEPKPIDVERLPVVEAKQLPAPAARELIPSTEQRPTKSTVPEHYLKDPLVGDKNAEPKTIIDKLRPWLKSLKDYSLGERYEASKELRTAINSVLANYGFVSNSVLNQTTLRGDLVKHEFPKASNIWADYNDRDGLIRLDEKTVARLERVVKRFVSGSFDPKDRTHLEEASAVKTMIHESLHNHSVLASPSAYKVKLGHVLEEATTEAAAAAVMKSAFNAVYLPTGARSWKDTDVSWTHYDGYIRGVMDGVRDAGLAKDNFEAFQLVANASMSMRRGVVRAQTPEDMLTAFVLQLPGQDEARAAFTASLIKTPPKNTSSAGSAQRIAFENARQAPGYAATANAVRAAVEKVYVKKFDSKKRRN